MSKKSNERKLLATGFKLISIVATTYLISYAWFESIKTYELGTFNFDTMAVNDVELSLDGGDTWQGSISLNIGEDYTFDRLVTSNGIDFKYAVDVDDSGVPTSFATAKEGRDYVEYSILLSSSLAAGIFLDKASFIEPEVGKTTEDIFGYDVTRRSSYGNFSKDLVASSVRLAIIENDKVGEVYVPQDTPKLVWAPNKNYEISCTSTCTADIESTNSQDYRYLNITAPTTYTLDRVENLRDVLNASSEDGVGGGDPMVSFAGSKEIKSITIRIWIEGNDRDAVTAVKGGQFKLGLRFTSIAKALDGVAPAVTADQATNTIVGYDATMEYTVNYGMTWTKYQNDANPTISEGATAYVRKQETGTNFASSYTTLAY